jgi:hypothetical protein
MFYSTFQATVKMCVFDKHGMELHLSASIAQKKKKGKVGRGFTKYIHPTTKGLKMSINHPSRLEFLSFRKENATSISSSFETYV